MPELWNALALSKNPMLSGHQYLKLPLGNPHTFLFAFVPVNLSRSPHCLRLQAAYHIS